MTQREAVTAELTRLDSEMPLWERFKRLREELGPLEDSGLVADKAFFDELSGNL